MDIYLKEKANKKSTFRFPSLPENISVKGDVNTQEYDIIRKGTYSFPSGPDVRSLKWKGYFWGKSRKGSVINQKWLAPSTCVKKLETWRDKGTVLNLIVSGGGINMDVTIQSFDYELFGGNGDFEYTIGFNRYREMQIQTVKELGIKKPAAVKRPSAASNARKHTVVQGENLWSIARKWYGGSGSDWEKIYNANKDIIESTAKKYGYASSNNGWWIFPGTVFAIP